MTSGPPLRDGEVIVFDHIPSLRIYKRSALLLLLVSLAPTLAFAVVLPDTYWVILPLFLTCILLVQERFKLGRHRAWVTNQRLIFQDETSFDLDQITKVKVRKVIVRLRHGDGRQVLTLYYPANGAALANAILSAQQEVK